MSESSICARSRSKDVVNVTFPLECLAGETRTSSNQIGLSGAEKPGTVGVTAPSEVHWSMTIGRGEPPA